MGSFPHFFSFQFCCFPFRVVINPCLWNVRGVFEKQAEFKIGFVSDFVIDIVEKLSDLSLVSI